MCCSVAAVVPGVCTVVLAPSPDCSLLQTASLAPSCYAPFFYAAAVLPVTTAAPPANLRIACVVMSKAIGIISVIGYRRGILSH